LFVVAGVAGALAAWRNRMLAANLARYSPAQPKPGGQGK
jgi:hypothetical protein